MQPKDWELDKQWADGYGPQIARILKDNVGALVSVSVATEEQDIKEATDLVVTVARGEVAVRLRRQETRHRDLTLRYQRLTAGRWTNGYEVSKILGGFARWYFYAWVKRKDIGDWLIADLDVIREAGLIEDAVEAGRKIVNKDKCTSFIWLTTTELWGIDALVASNIERAELSLIADLYKGRPERLAEVKANERAYEALKQKAFEPSSYAQKWSA